MHSALIVLTEPAAEAKIDIQNNWTNAVGFLRTLSERHEAVTMLNAGSLLCAVGDNGDNSLYAVLKICNDQSVPHQILFFESAPAWVTCLK